MVVCLALYFFQSGVRKINKILNATDIVCTQLDGYVSYLISSNLLDFLLCNRTAILVFQTYLSELALHLKFLSQLRIE